MKNNYYSAKLLSKWFRLKNQWISTYQKLQHSAKIGTLQKLNKLSLTLGIKKKIAIGSLAMMATLGAQAQISFEEERSYVDFNNITAEGKSITFLDYDKDGDLDIINYRDSIITSHIYYSLEYFNNDGQENFTKIEGNNNPFDGILLTSGYTTPTIVDLDEDGDFDIVYGEYDGTFTFLSNDGTGAFTEKTGANNPLDGLDVGTYSSPTFVDFDDDGDLDILSANYDGNIKYYKNNGASGYAEQLGTDNPLGNITLGTYSELSFSDVDQDGDLDLVYTNGNEDSPQYYENDNGSFVQKLNADNPFDRIQFRSGKITFIDLDFDQDEEIVGVTSSGRYFSYYNDQASFRRARPINISSLQSDSLSTPAFGQFDGVRVWDMMSGNSSGSFSFYEGYNSGGYQQKTGNSPFSGNPFFYQSVPSKGAPTIGDFDGDGDGDMLVGQEDGTFTYYEDLHTLRTAASGRPSVFESLDVGENSKPTFVDLNKDTLIDLVSGEASGGFYYFQQDSLGALIEQTGSDNPFDGLSVSGNSAPAFADLDNDDDMDLISGSTDGTFHYFENDGNNNFTELTGSDNPFDGFDIGEESTPTFVDLVITDKLDLVSGSKSGAFHLFRNTSSPIVTGLAEVVFTEKEKTIVYPNPTTNELFVDAKGVYNITNTSGLVVITGNIDDSKRINVSELDNGLYILNVEGKTSTFIKH